jgi:hypothetical protein
VRRALILLLVAAGGLGMALVLLWQLLVVPWTEVQLSRATGYRAVIGSLTLFAGGFRAHQVTLYGAAPFSSSPLARIAHLEITLGGPGYPRFRPSEVSARGVQITYLRAGPVDNVRGPGRQALASGLGARPPRLTLREGRLDAFVRVGPGYPLVARARKLTLDRPPGGPLSAEVEAVAVDLPGLLTVTAPRIRWSSSGANRAVSGEGLRIVMPGGGTLLDHIDLRGELLAEAARLDIRSAAPGPPGSAPALTAHVELGPGGANGTLEIPRLPLAALRPLVRGLGIETGVALAGLELVLTAQADGRSHLRVDLEAENLGLAHPRLDRGYWGGLDLSIRGLMVLDPGNGRIEVDRNEVSVLGLPLLVSGWSERLPHWRGEWKIETPSEGPPGCESLMRAQAEPIRRALAGLELRGKLGLAASVAFDSSRWEGLGLSVQVEPCRVEREPAVLQALLGALAGGAAGRPAWRDLPISKHHPDFVSRDRMSRHLTAAFITAEDGRFYQHRGFDLEMIRRALAHDLTIGALARGASTITQQLAKNLFLGPERTLARKLAELVLSWRIHETLGKQEQIELYLNAIELGPGIRGVKRAAEVYFGKPVSTLTPLECAHLAALTPNPLGFARRFREGRVDEGWLHRLYDLLGMMKRSGRLSGAELNSARQSRLTLRRI